MITCRCPQCQTLFDVRSDDFGSVYRCPVCRAEFVLDRNHLARFQVPRILRIHLVDEGGLPVCLENIAVLVSRGYMLPPLLTDEKGTISIPIEMFLLAQADEISTGLMDHKGDDSLNRYLSIDVPSPSQLRALGEGRRQSGWPILPLEAELYGDLDRLCAVYDSNNNALVCPSRMQMDLSRGKEEMDVPIRVRQNVRETCS